MYGTFGIILISFFLKLSLADTFSEPNIYTTGKYKYFIEAKNKYTWAEAAEKCKNRQMNLLTIDSKEKADDVHIIINEAFLYEKKPVPGLYIGANDLDEFRTFKWVATNESFSYTNWLDHEPNNYREQNERCVHIGHLETEQWNDIKCKNKYGYICEQLLGVEELSSYVLKQ